YPWRSPLQSGVLGGVDPSILSYGQETLGTLFSKAGYNTGAFGKWHLGMGWKRLTGERRSAFDNEFEPDLEGDGKDIDYHAPIVDGPLEHGFHRYFGIAGSLDMPPYCFIDQDRTVGVPDQEKEPLVTSQRNGYQVEGWKDDEVDTTVADVAARWIRDAALEDVPFFAYVASAAPHRPCVPPSFIRGSSTAGA